MKNLKTFYLICTILGAVLPWYAFAVFFITEGLDVPLFIDQLFATHPATGFTVDILISSFVFWVWSYQDAQKRGIKQWWWILPANLLVGLSMALPLYLYWREDT